ncbi:MAG: hypothetical protein HKN77_05480, partial [Woeseiaceae bacterium]|nr:hypothetical protein [Woeseiaceae bacterium]
MLTREKTLRDQLLIREGDAFDARLLAESERILRSNKYLYDASIAATKNGDGGIDVLVKTKDVWSFTPEISVSRKGGENKTIFGVEESNLFGKGILVLFSRSDDVDRTSTAFEYVDRNIGHHRIAFALRTANNSDGHSHQINLARPFFALDTRRAGGTSFYDDDRRGAFYSLGDEVAEYRHERALHSAYFGWSSGLRNDWVRRWTAGVVHDENRFSAPSNATLPVLLPIDRKLVYPYVGLEILEDRFEKSTNSDQIDRSEDFYLGTRLTASLGYASRDFGSDRNAFIYSTAISRGYGTLGRRALLISAATGGRLESGRSANSLSRVNTRLYWRQSEKRLFVASIDALHGQALDLDSRIAIGGDSGLRGYPLRYQTGESRLLISLEQRYFTDLYPFRLFRVGGAVFFDAGRSWGANPAGGPKLGWLR